MKYLFNTRWNAFKLSSCIFTATFFSCASNQCTLASFVSRYDALAWLLSESDEKVNVLLLKNIRNYDKKFYFEREEQNWLLVKLKAHD
jgi:hypothetical protein